MFSGILTEIYKDIRGSIQKKNEELEAEKVAIENATHQYEKNYRERHGQVKVFCVGMREPLPLDDVYVAVQFVDDQGTSRYGSPEDIEKAFRQRYPSRSASNADKRKDGTVVANEKQYLMLLGGPGVGKSTFLRKVGLEALKEENGNFEHACIPVFLELKTFTADQIDIKALIIEEFRTCGYPDPEQMTKTALKLGKLLILFDGLDEVPAANLDNVMRKIGDFVDRYSQNRFIASCRIAAYKGGFTRFTDVEMAEFDDAQIETYIKNWFDSTPHQYRYQLDKEMKTAEQCWRALNAIGHRATKELARNPLLLTLLCMVYDNSQNFPRNRADLYEKALSIFLEEWVAEKRVRREESISQYLDIAAEKRMLSEIAARNFEENRLFFTKDELIDQIQEFGKGDANTPPAFNASKILETILVDQGLFIERVRGSYSFSHLTFQEYLTANYIVRDTRSIQALVSDHLHNEQWREIFLLTAGRMHIADDLLEAMESEVAKCINTDALKILLEWTERITDTANASINQTAKRAFAIRQYCSLWLVNKIYDEIQNDVNCYRDHYRDFNFYKDQNQTGNRKFHEYIFLYQDVGYYSDLYRDLEFYPNFSRDREFYRKLYQELYLHGDSYLHRDLDLDFYVYLYLDYSQYFNHIIYSDNRRLHIAPGILVSYNQYLYFYQDLYQYINEDFYLLASPKFGDRFERELDNRISFVEYVEQLKIFKGVDLQRMIGRFAAQQEFIKEAREEKSVKPPEESIHDTWLSVLQITDDMLAISREEMKNYVWYLRAVELIVDCKEAAGRVSPEVWEGIEKRFLTLDAVKVGRTKVAKSS